MIPRLAICCLTALSLAASAHAQPPVPVEGSDYARIEPALPMAPTPGRIEVVEVFNHSCPGCVVLEPRLEAWKKTAPPDVEFRYLPAAFGGWWMPYARAYLAADALGIADKTHNAFYLAIHSERGIPDHSAEAGPKIAEWFGTQGADPATFAATMESFAVDTRIKRSQQLTRHWGIAVTPSFVVNGKYRVPAGPEGGAVDLLRVVDWLIAREQETAAAAIPPSHDRAGD